MGGLISAIIFLIIVVATINSILRQVREQQERQIGRMGRPQDDEYKASPEEVRQFLEQLLGEQEVAPPRRPVAQPPPAPEPPRRPAIVEPDVVIEKLQSAYDPYEHPTSAPPPREAFETATDREVLPPPPARPPRRAKGKARLQAKAQGEPPAPPPRQSPRTVSEVGQAAADHPASAYEKTRGPQRFVLDIRNMDLRKAVVFYEIFGPPKSMRGNDPGIPVGWW